MTLDIRYQCPSGEGVEQIRSAIGGNEAFSQQ